MLRKISGSHGNLGNHSNFSGHGSGKRIATETTRPVVKDFGEALHSAVIAL